METIITIFKDELEILYDYVEFLQNVLKESGINRDVMRFQSIKISGNDYSFNFWINENFVPTKTIPRSHFRSITEQFFDISDFDIFLDYATNWRISFTVENV